MDLSYKFEITTNGMYQVRLHGEFVCYSHNTDEKEVDEFLKREGYKSREEYLVACLEILKNITEAHTEGDRS